MSMPSIPPDPSRLYLSELNHPERALLLAIRALLDPADCRGWVMWDFGRLFRGAENSALAFAALRGFVRVLAGSARAAPRVHDFENHALAADERAVLMLVAAIQAQHSDHTQAILRWLLPAAAQAAALIYAAALAGLMAENGARLDFHRNTRPAFQAAPLMRVGPVGAHADIGDQRHAELDGGERRPFHYALDDARGFLDAALFDLEQELVMDLEKHARGQVVLREGAGDA